MTTIPTGTAQAIESAFDDGPRHRPYVIRLELRVAAPDSLTAVRQVVNTGLDRVEVLELIVLEDVPSAMSR